MAQTAEQLAEHAAQTGGDGHAPGHAEHPFLAHHFDNPRHQFESGKLGIWLFLVTEVLFFGGLFCAYAIYRSLHPEIFVWAHYYLDTFWGAVNTGVLIVSSLTAAWAVRNAQLGEQKKLVINIIATIALAFCFLCVKYVEYSHKFHENVLPGRHFNPTYEAWELESYKKAHGDPGGPVYGPRQLTPVAGLTGDGPATNYPSGAAPGHAPGSALAGDPAPGNNAPSVPGAAVPSNAVPGSTAPGTTIPGSAVAGSSAPASTAAGSAGSGSIAPSSVPPGGVAPGGVAPGGVASAGAPSGTAAPGSAAPGTAVPGGSVPVNPAPAGALPAPVVSGSEAPAMSGTTKRAPPGAPDRPHHVSVFFSIYFFMTGLHGVHVVAGIITWLWILRRALRGEFGPQHFGAVDYAALYWHLVDLIWIYLFPLLYLIH